MISFQSLRLLVLTNRARAGCHKSGQMLPVCCPFGLNVPLTSGLLSWNVYG